MSPLQWRVKILRVCEEARHFVLVLLRNCQKLCLSFIFSWTDELQTSVIDDTFLELVSAIIRQRDIFYFLDETDLTNYADDTTLYRNEN